MTDPYAFSAPQTAVTCAICGEFHGWRWTDSHGIGACLNCGAPHRLYHYENEKRVQKPPECLIRAEWLDVTRRYWIEKRRNVSPGAFNFPGSSYEVAERADFESWNNYCEAHREEFDAIDALCQAKDHESEPTVTS